MARTLIVGLVCMVMLVGVSACTKKDAPAPAKEKVEAPTAAPAEPAPAEPTPKPEAPQT